MFQCVMVGITSRLPDYKTMPGIFHICTFLVFKATFLDKI